MSDRASASAERLKQRRSELQTSSQKNLKDFKDRTSGAAKRASAKAAERKKMKALFRFYTKCFDAGVVGIKIMCHNVKLFLFLLLNKYLLWYIDLNQNYLANNANIDLLLIMLYSISSKLVKLFYQY